jgi:predicted MPP superfamily phosphohydrolase
LCLTAQVIAWRLCLRRSDNRWFKLAVHVVFTAFNLGYLAVFYLVPRGGMDGELWTWVGRPAISWQAVHVLAVLPAAGIAWILYLASRAMFRSIRWTVRRLLRKAPDGAPAEVLPEAVGPASAGKGAAAPDAREGAPGFLASLGLLPSGAVGDLADPAAAKDAPEAQKAPKGRQDPAFRESRRDFVRYAGSAGILGILGLAGYGVFRQTAAPVARRLSLSYPWLPRELHGFTIAHLTDFHLGLWSNPREMELAVERAGLEKPDMVVFTGDMVDRSPDLALAYGKPVSEHLSKAPYGVWGVLGNHDHFSDPARIARGLASSGVKVLRERRANVGGLPLSLTGLDDQGVRGSWLNRRQTADENSKNILDFSRVTGPPERPGDFRILLNHRPEGFRQAAEDGGFGLYLAGHTHGGQYSFPNDPQVNLGAMVWTYTSGLYSGWDSHLNVSCGLASVGIPFRFGPWPEFSVITLLRGPAGGKGPRGA